MKHLKIFENFITDKKVYGSKYVGMFYFIPYVDEKLARLAIEKLEISDEVKKDILECKELFEVLESNKVIKYNVGFFISTSNNTKYSFSFWACSIEDNKDEGYKTYMGDFRTNYFYGGEITLEDWEISANKYNI